MLSPIISQVTTPLYQLANALNQLFISYLPTKYIINSANEFLQILHSHAPQNEILGKLDFANLFTNVSLSMKQLILF